MNKSVEIIIAEDGSIKIEGKGFSGPDCLKATRAFEEALGAVTDRRKKPEFNQLATQTNARKATV